MVSRQNEEQTTALCLSVKFNKSKEPTNPDGDFANQRDLAAVG